MAIAAETPRPRIRDFEDPSYNPFTAMKELGGEGGIKDFYPELKRLRDLSPVYDGDLAVHFGLHPDLTLMGLRHVAILGHAEVRDVLQSPDRFSNRVYERNLGVYFGRSVTVMDNPDHRRYRALFQKAFMPKPIAAWSESILPRVIDALIADFEGDGRAELVSQFTLNFPFHFIHELLRLPQEDRDIFHKLAFGQILISFDHDHGMEAVVKLKDYLTELVLDRRDRPVEDDFISIIATAEIEGERLPDEVVISFFRQLMNAGGDTSFNGFSTVLAALLTHPDQLEAVRQDRSLVPRAIEEGLRWNSPVPAIFRTPAAPVEIGGVGIEPGDVMHVMLASANRDEKAYPNPDAFDISRGARGHAAFGLGPHICIGQHLARAEMTQALNTLLDRFPRLRLDPDHPAPEVSGFHLRGPDQLHVRFD